MRKPKEILTDIREDIMNGNRKKQEEDPERMDFLMKAIKAVHSASTDPAMVSNPEEFEKRRASVDTFSRLITPGITVDEEYFETDGVKCEKASPKFAHRKDKIIMYCHGGGFISGGLGYAGILAAKLAIHTGLETVTFEYRLAPENPYPAAIEDAVKVWDCLMQKGYGAKDIILAGDSAGGNLALELCLSLRDEGRLLPKALVLFSPWTDLSGTSASYKTYKEKDPLLTYEYVMCARSAYAGSDADFEDPKYSPLKADLTGMPPALVQVGSNEILRDDSEKLAKALRRHGSMAKYEMYPGGWHVFQQMPIPKAAAALDNVKKFLDEVL